MAGGSTSADRSTYVVTTVDDPVTTAGRADARHGDSICNVFAEFTGNGSGAANPPTCTLRAAMEEANAHGGHEQIAFSIPGSGVHRIEPVAALPMMTDPAGVTIDGYTQPGAQVNTADHGSNAVLRIEAARRRPRRLRRAVLQPLRRQPRARSGAVRLQADDPVLGPRSAAQRGARQLHRHRCDRYLRPDEVGGQQHRRAARDGRVLATASVGPATSTAT